MEIRVAIGEIRRGLGRPNDVEMSDADILMEIWQVTTLLRTRLMLTEEAWQVKRVRLDVPAGTERVGNITATDIGTIFLIRTENTSGNPYFIGRTVDVVRLDQLSQFYSGPENLALGATYWHPHTATAMAPFYEDGQWKMMWSTPHREAAAYTLYYTPGAAILPPLFDDTTLFPLEEQHFYIIADCVINLMPHLADRKIGLDLRQQALASVAEKKMKQWEPVFYARAMDGVRKENTTKHKSFGDSRYGPRGSL